MMSPSTSKATESAASLAQSRRWYLWGALLCGLFVFVVVLAFHCVADGDLWAKLALGASVWERAPGGLLRHDIFAFTPTLPAYVDHEWGSGLIFYTLLRVAGPTSLMLLKIALALTAIGVAALVGRRLGASWEAVLFVAAPSAFCVLPGYVPVVRSHAFSYALFALTLGCLEAMATSPRRAGIALVVIVAVWANVHGGWVAGLGIIGLYTAAAVWKREQAAWHVGLLLASVAVTSINPYGFEYWRYLVPAVLHPRPHILEWRPMPWWGMDAFLGFRVLLALAILVIATGFRRSDGWKSGLRLVVLIITALLAIRSRRHAPFFGLAALCFLGPYVDAALSRLRAALPRMLGQAHQLAQAAFILYGGLAVWASLRILPQATLTVLAPVGVYPVREVDILASAHADGNLALPFGWGSYASWRLYPRVKVSIDGRYEAAYPESTFLMNQNFFDRTGTNWDRLVREYPVDFVMLDLAGNALRPEDLAPYGFELVWRMEGISALLGRGAALTSLQRAARDLPATSIEPLDAGIPRNWPWP